MREDMYKVIVERPRRWKDGYATAARLRDDCSGPTRLRMRAGYGYRSLNENLAPLHLASRWTFLPSSSGIYQELYVDPRTGLIRLKCKCLYGSDDLYAVSKRQISTREIKAHRLRG